jgi:hypothetical protein
MAGPIKNCSGGVILRGASLWGEEILTSFYYDGLNLEIGIVLLK